MKNLIIGGLLILISGAANGLHETLHYHYGAFTAKYPKANPRYWNPVESWKLAFTTDAKHSLSEAHRTALVLGTVLLTFGIFSSEWRWRMTWRYKMGLLFIAAYIAQAAGFHLVYTLLF